MNDHEWNESHLQAILAGQMTGPVRFYASVTSTNTLASNWADQGAPDLSLVVADQQTGGRGRSGRKWYTPPGTAIAASLILRIQDQPTIGPDPNRLLLRYTALGALAICDALHALYHLTPQIKWPNDVLICGRKVCGILAEAHWIGDQLWSIILGIGVNVTPQSLPAEGELLFPATCVQNHVSHVVTRASLLGEIINQVISWRSTIYQPCFIQAWEERLAFKDSWVNIFYDPSVPGAQPTCGQLKGLDKDGQLVLMDQNDKLLTIEFGELRLRLT